MIVIIGENHTFDNVYGTYQPPSRQRIMNLLSEGIVNGTRVPMVVISPYAKPGYISHSYTDHVSLLKFIERNWHPASLSQLSLDRLPNPTTHRNKPLRAGQPPGDRRLHTR